MDFIPLNNSLFLPTFGIYKILIPKSVTLARSAQLEFEKIGVPSTYVNLEVIFGAARAALSPEEFAAAWAEGEVRSLADVVEELLHADEVSEE